MQIETCTSKEFYEGKFCFKDSVLGAVKKYVWLLSWGVGLSYLFYKIVQKLYFFDGNWIKAILLGIVGAPISLLAAGILFSVPAALFFVIKDANTRLGDIYLCADDRGIYIPFETHMKIGGTWLFIGWNRIQKMSNRNFVCQNPGACSEYREAECENPSCSMRMLSFEVPLLTYDEYQTIKEHSPSVVQKREVGEILVVPKRRKEAPSKVFDALGQLMENSKTHNKEITADRYRSG